jgi:hypothetical protein
MSSNFLILENGPIASPGACSICGYPGADRRYLDPRKDFEFYGTFIICETCVGSMAQDFNFLQPAQAQALEVRVEEAEREITILRQAILHLENAHDSFGDLHALLNGSLSAGVGEHVNAPVEPLPTLDVGADSISSKLEGLGDPEADKSISLPRSSDLSDDLLTDEQLIDL